MLFILIGIVWLFIILISLFGDYKTKEMNKDYAKFNEMVGKK